MHYAEGVLLQIEQANPVDEHHTKHNISDEVYCYKVGNNTLILTSHIRGSICLYTNELIFPSTAQCIQDFFIKLYMFNPV